MSLVTCFAKAGKAAHADDKNAIISRARALRGEGKSADEAAKQAVLEQIEAVQGMLPAKEAAQHEPVKTETAKIEDAQAKSGEDDASNLALESPRDRAYTAPYADQPAPPARAETARPDAVRGPDAAVPDRPRITALGIAERIERTGSQALVGQIADTPDALAALAQVYRDPRYETFRIFFTRGDEIIHATGLSARMPGHTPIIPAGMKDAEYVQWFRDQMRPTSEGGTGADGYYILHNHPTGNPTPSQVDLRMTARLFVDVPGMRAHVVINSNKYAVIEPGKEVRVEHKDFGPDLLLQASQPGPLIGKIIDSSNVLAVIGKSVQKPGYLTLIGTDSSGSTRLVADAPATILRRPNAVLAAMLRRSMRLSGSDNLFLIGSDGDVASQPVQSALVQGILRDAIGETGASQRQRGTEPLASGFRDGTPGRPMAEEGAPYHVDGTPLVPQVLPALQKPTRWRDSMGRFQLAPGAWLWEKMGEKAAPLLEAAGMKATSPELRRQMRAMKLQVQKAQDFAVGVAKESAGMSDAERALVSDLIEKELAAGTVPPAHAVRLATAINALMGKQTDELVSLGMLSKETAERWRGQYLPRFYKSKLSQAADPWVAAVRNLRGKPAAMKGIGGKSLNGRGLWETVPAADIAEWQALGWEIRDPDYEAGTSTEAVVWRDYTGDERAKMGEIRDAGFRFVMGYMRTQKDIALGRMFEGIAADPALTSKGPHEGWVQVPDTSVPGTMGVKRYGKLSGRWVKPEVLSQLSRHQEADNEALSMYRKVMGAWKEGKTALNPVAHFNNTVSNLSMAHFAGVSYWDAHKYAGAIHDLATKAERVTEARDAGLFLGSMSDEELLNNLPDELRALAQKQRSNTAKTASFAFNAMTFFLRKPLGKLYQAEDSFFRYLLYRDARLRGLAPSDAVDHAQKFIFTYDDLPATARKVRDFAIPFFAYTYKAVPALLHTALTRPHALLAPASVLWAVNAMSYLLADGGDDDDWVEKLQKYINDKEFRERLQKQQDAERAHLPPWLRGTSVLLSPKAIRLGIDELTGMPLFMDASRIIPGGDLFDVSANAGGLPLPQPITPNHPLFTTFGAMILNKDAFTGKDLVDPNDTRAEAAEKRALWAWRQIAPAIAVGNYHWERGMQAVAQATGQTITWWPDDATGIGKDGLPIQPKHAAMQTFGAKVRPYDLDTAEKIEGSLRARMLRDIDTEMAAMKRLWVKGAVSDRQFDAAKDKALEKKQRVRDGLTVDGDSVK